MIPQLTTSPTHQLQVSGRSYRLDNIDMLRGLVIVIMAIDHVRDYFNFGGEADPMANPDVGAALFFTRWITHFCAPVFVFLAGTAAFLQLRRHGVRAALARYLLVRGLILVALELTLIRFSWTFNWNYGAFTLAGVIWMLGWCMVLMSGLIWLPTWAVGATGVVLVAGQNAFQAAAPASGAATSSCASAPRRSTATTASSARSTRKQSASRWDSLCCATANCSC